MLESDTFGILRFAADDQVRPAIEQRRAARSG
jgi:hypothetical protein